MTLRMKILMMKRIYLFFPEESNNFGEKEITTSEGPDRREIVQSQPLEADPTKR